MLPFCGYNMGDYFAHWLKLGAAADAAKLPKIYFVNWFRKDARGKFMWPGYGENSRVLKWIFQRLEGQADAVATPIGNLPVEGGLDVTDLDLSPEALHTLTTVDREVWREEASHIPPFYERFAGRLPTALWDEYAALLERLGEAPPAKSAAAVERLAG
jgi:phosphoenolpyruvate carboxykinase (GTP)